MRFLGLILGLLLVGSVVGIQESLSTPPSKSPGSVKLGVSTLPKLNEEFELFIYLVPEWWDWNKPIDKKTPIKFSITLPNNFEIIDNDFSKGGKYGFRLLDDYQTFSTTRDLEFPFQT